MWIALVAAALLLPSMASARDPGDPHPLAGELSLTTGFDLQSGDFGQAVDTDILYVPLSITYTADQLALTRYPDDLFELRVTVPYLRSRAPRGTISAADARAMAVRERTDVATAALSPRGRRALRRSRKTEEGLGDVVVRATYIWLPPGEGRAPWVEISGRVKAPTASRADRLGTGETDFGLQLDLYQTFGQWTPLASVGYRFVGKSDLFLGLRDGVFASGGLTWRPVSALSTGLIYDWYEAGSAAARDGHELFGFLTWRARDWLRVGPYGAVGLSRGSPDYRIGFQIKTTIDLR